MIEFLQGVVTSPEGWFCLLTKGDAATEEWFKWPDDAEAIVQRANELQDRNVYFSPHLFSKQDSHKEFVLKTRTIAADLDNADITDLPLSPSYLVETSSGRHQAYWILKDELPLEQLELLSKKLSYTIENCDHSGWPLGHRFRVPNTKNFKYDPSPTVKLVPGLSSERIYVTQEIEDVVKDTDVTGPSSTDQWIESPPGDLAQGPREILEKYKVAIGSKAFSYFGIRQADRSEALWHLMLALFRAGATRDEVYWIAKNSANNKFVEHRYNGERDLAKDVDRAQRAEHDDTSSPKAMVILAEHSGGTANDRKRIISKIVLQDLMQRGEFVYTDDGRYWYLYANAGRPMSVSKRSEQLESLLDSIYGLNASDGYQPYVINHLLAHTLSKGRRASTSVLSYYDGQSLLLHSGRQDVYRIQPDSVSRHPDGQFGVLFPWRGSAEEPITLDEPVEGNWCDWMFEGWFTNLLDMEPEQAKVLVRVWTLFVLFRDQAVSRPIITLLGQPGSGKSTFFRMIYTLFYGSKKSVNAISSPDDFDFLVATDPIVFFDNVDSWSNWLPDRLALSASSSDLIKRKLYTDSDTVTLKRQAVVGISAHDPRFGRADVVDRMIILNFQRIADRDFIPEKILVRRVQEHRAQLWGSIVQDVQKVLREPEPTQDEIPSFRISDFAHVGTRIAKALGIYKEFYQTIERLRQSQTAFSLSEEDILVDVIKRWQANRNGSEPEYVSPGYLWEMFDAMEPSFQKGYKTSGMLARRLWTMQANLRSVFEIDFRYDAHRGIRLWKIGEKK